MPGKVGGEKQGSGLGGQDPGLGSQGLAEVNYELRIKDWEFPPEFSPLPAAYCFRGGGGLADSGPCWSLRQYVTLVKKRGNFKKMSEQCRNVHENKGQVRRG